MVISWKGPPPFWWKGIEERRRERGEKRFLDKDIAGTLGLWIYPYPSQLSAELAD